MTKDEQKIYGLNRFPKAYKKKKILGKGGCAIVYLAEHRETGEEFAIK